MISTIVQAIFHATILRQSIHRNSQVTMPKLCLKIGLIAGLTGADQKKRRFQRILYG